MIKKIKQLLTWWKTTVIAKVLARFSLNKGSLLCGGIAYSALFSLFAGLTIAFTVFISTLGSNEELKASFIETVDGILPGLISQDGSGLLSPEQLVFSSGIGIAAVIAVVLLVSNALRALGALRAGCLAMLETSGQQKENLIKAKLRELSTLLIVGVFLVFSAAFGVLVNTMQHWFGQSAFARFSVQSIGFLFSLAIDMLLFLVIIKLLAGHQSFRPQILLPAGLVALGFGIIRLLGTSAISATDNPLLAPFAALATVLLWLNLSARILLLGCALLAELENPSPDTETKTKSTTANA